MRSKLKLFASFFVVTGLIAGAVFNQKTEAVVNGTNELVSYDSTNTSPVGSDQAAPSDDGKFVVFTSTYSNVVTGDVNGKNDVFIRNMETGVNTLVDQSTGGVWAQSGVEGDAASVFSVSKTGRYVLFSSADQYLIDGQVQDGKVHVYLRDTVTGTTVLVDQTAAGVVGNENARVGDISDDGRFAFFSSKARNLGGATDGYLRVYMKDLSNGNLQVLSRSASGVNANNAASNVRASCDGSIAIFVSPATNLTAGNNGYSSVYLVDLRNGFKITNLTLLANNYVNPASVSCDGRYIVLLTRATNLTADVVSGTVQHVFRYDRISGAYELIDRTSSGAVATAGDVLSPDLGRKVSDSGAVVFTTQDPNIVTPAVTYRFNPYLRTPEDNTTELVSVNPLGQEGAPGFSAYSPHSLAITSNGKGIVYTSNATNLIPGVTTLGSSFGSVVLSKVQ